MKIHLESTDEITTIIPGSGGEVPARLWKGETEEGIPIIALITRIGVPHNRPEEEHQRFRDSLIETRTPIPAGKEGKNRTIAGRIIL